MQYPFQSSNALSFPIFKCNILSNLQMQYAFQSSNAISFPIFKCNMLSNLQMQYPFQSSNALSFPIFKCNILSNLQKGMRHNYGITIQNFHLGRYIIGYMVGNLVLRQRACGAVKHDFETYIRRYTSPNENFEYGYHHSNAFLQFHLKLECCKRHNAARHPTKCDIINDVKLFPTVAN